jgi:hypothetical protein
MPKQDQKVSGHVVTSSARPSGVFDHIYGISKILSAILADFDVSQYASTNLRL